MDVPGGQSSATNRIDENLRFYLFKVKNSEEKVCQGKMMLVVRYLNISLVSKLAKLISTPQR